MNNRSLKLTALVLIILGLLAALYFTSKESIVDPEVVDYPIKTVLSELVDENTEYIKVKYIALIKVESFALGIAIIYLILTRMLGKTNKETFANKGVIVSFVLLSFAIMEIISSVALIISGYIIIS